MDISHLLLYILVCILLIGFFAGTEIAFISANKLNIELRKKQGKFSGQILARFMENPSEFIEYKPSWELTCSWSSMACFASQLTNKILLNYGILLPEYTKLIIDTLLATLVILIFCRVPAKSCVFRSKAEVVLTIFSVPMLLMVLHLFPRC